MILISPFLYLIKKNFIQRLSLDHFVNGWGQVLDGRLGPEMIKAVSLTV